MPVQKKSTKKSTSEKAVSFDEPELAQNLTEATSEDPMDELP